MRLIDEERPVGTCACGCGAVLTERVYEFRRGNTVWIKRRQPRFLPGHASRLRANWLASTVPAEEIASRVVDFKHRHSLTWAQVAEVLGLGSASQAQALTRRRRIKRWRARLILLALAGEPRPPTAYERKVADQQLGRHILAARATRRREQRAAARTVQPRTAGAPPGCSSAPQSDGNN
jgi:hypothetical protein